MRGTTFLITMRVGARSVAPKLGMVAVAIGLAWLFLALDAWFVADLVGPPPAPGWWIWFERAGTLIAFAVILNDVRLVPGYLRWRRIQRSEVVQDVG